MNEAPSIEDEVLTTEDMYSLLKYPSVGAFRTARSKKAKDIPPPSYHAGNGSRQPRWLKEDVLSYLRGLSRYNKKPANKNSNNGRKRSTPKLRRA